jgi:undecaprenyl-diphosphatase
MLETFSGLDKNIFLFINSALSNGFSDNFFTLITNGRFWILPGIAAALIFIWRQKKKALIIIGLALITVSISDPVCNRIIKPAVHRLRPCNPHVNIEGGRFLLGQKTSLSFPSSHAMNIFAQAMLFSLFYRKKTVWFFLFASIIGYSRIYTGAHYPFDVLGGAVFGICIGAIVFYSYVFILNKIRNRFQTGIPD